MYPYIVRVVNGCWVRSINPLYNPRVQIYVRKSIASNEIR